MTLNWLLYYDIVFRGMIFVFAWEIRPVIDGARTSHSARQEQWQSARRATSAPDVNIRVTFSYVSHETPNSPAVDNSAAKTTVRQSYVTPTYRVFATSSTQESGAARAPKMQRVWEEFPLVLSVGSAVIGVPFPRKHNYLSVHGKGMFWCNFTEQMSQSWGISMIM